MTTSPSAAVSAGPMSLVVRSIHAMAEGDRAAFYPLYHPRATDRENQIQPPSSRVQGPACFYSTALWLRAAFEGLHYDIHHAVADHWCLLGATQGGLALQRVLALLGKDRSDLPTLGDGCDGSLGRFQG